MSMFEREAKVCLIKMNQRQSFLSDSAARKLKLKFYRGRGEGVYGHGFDQFFRILILNILIDHASYDL